MIGSLRRSLRPVRGKSCAGARARCRRCRFGIVRIVADNQSHDGAHALLGVPVQRLGDQVAVVVAARDFDCRRRRQPPFRRSARRSPASAPSSAISARRLFSAIRAPPFTANARAISRLPALPGCAFRNSMICSLLGMSPLAGARAFFRLPGARIVSGPNLGFRPAVGFAAVFFGGDFFGADLRLAAGLPPSPFGAAADFSALLWRSLRFSRGLLSAALFDALCNQRHRFVHCQARRFLALRHGGVDLVVAHVGAVTAGQHLRPCRPPPDARPGPSAP